MSENQASHRKVPLELRRLRQRYLEDRLRLLRNAFPETFADAERFVRETSYAPWEFGVMFAEGELGELQDKYEVIPLRHRPHSEDVPSETDLFCEAAELILEQMTAEAASASRSTDLYSGLDEMTTDVQQG